MPNRLADATSRYLRQHADSPVAWFPWCADAFDEAQQRGVPIFVSLGYSTCHWCHVMAEESFADPHTADLLNERFVAIKVDSEERPDLNTTYMHTVQAMTGRGGWPISVFLTPAGTPFLAGSYWPKQARDGLPSFEQVVTVASQAWRERPAEVTARAEQLSSYLAARARLSPGPTLPETAATDEAARLVIETQWDRTHGGFGPAPKFPHPMILEWLLHRHARTEETEPLQAAVHSLTAMARSPLRDHLGGGFSRYTVDSAWSSPHFEQMLYDNALLLPTYAAAATLTGEDTLAQVARSTARYLTTQLQRPHGGFASATDADADGREGGYYTWTYDELIRALDDIGVDSRNWARFLGATPEGNWNGTNLLQQALSPDRMAQTLGATGEAWHREWDRVRDHLTQRRARRALLGIEERVLADWNALAVRGLARAGQLLDEPDWLEAAAAGAEFLHERLVVDGRLHHAWKDGKASVPGFLLDYAALSLADLELFQTTGEPTYFDRALALATDADERFGDAGHPGWRETLPGGPGQPAVWHTASDNALPAGSSVMTEVCLFLARVTGENRWQVRAETAIGARQDRARRDPLHHGWLLRQIETLAAPPITVVIVGMPGAARDALTQVATRRPRPGTVTVTAAPTGAPTGTVLDGRSEIDGQPAAYVCRAFTCQPPVTTAADLTARLQLSDPAATGPSAT